MSFNFYSVILTARLLLFFNLAKGGLPRPTEQNVEKKPRVANSSRNLSQPVCFVDFVGLRCRFAFLLSPCPDVGSEGNGENWYLVSRARCLLVFSAPNAYLSIASAQCFVYTYPMIRIFIKSVNISFSMAVTLHDHITSPVVFGNNDMHLFLVFSDVRKYWYLHDCTYQMKYSIFRSMYNNKL